MSFLHHTKYSLSAMTLRSLFICSCLVLMTLACRTTQSAAEEPKDVQDNPGIIANQFIVKLKPGVQPETLSSTFQQYGLTLKKMINKSMNLWVFTYRQESLEPENMLLILKESEHVQEAEFDKRLSNRRN
ncbi:MAG: hypothetical protein AAF587_08990 [Bacteroidota bacterium]